MPELRLRAGQFHVPFSLEEYGTSDNFIDFIERSMVNELTPTRDRGVKIYGDLGLMDGIINYNLGGFNGTGEDTSDNNGDKDLAFRLEYSPFRTSKSFWLKGLQFAGNVTWGNERQLDQSSGTNHRSYPQPFYLLRLPNRAWRAPTLRWRLRLVGRPGELEVRIRRADQRAERARPRWY